MTQKCLLWFETKYGFAHLNSQSMLTIHLIWQIFVTAGVQVLFHHQNIYKSFFFNKIIQSKNVVCYFIIGYVLFFRKYRLILKVLQVLQITKLEKMENSYKVK